MFKIIISLSLTFLVINLFVTSCEGFREERNSDNYERDYIGYPNSLSSLSSGGLSSEPTRSGLGISAWGIVTIIVSLMLAIVGMYYISICYPVLCKKSRKCDMLHLTPAV